MAILAVTGGMVFASCGNSGTGDGNDGEPTGSYVDLGLPSGTKWKDVNEANAADTEYGFYTYDEAVAAFGDKLPTKEQFDELKENCEWTWLGNGYSVTGSNGNSIVLPAAGYRHCDGVVLPNSFRGYYWSSTPMLSVLAWMFDCCPDSVSVAITDRCHGHSVRLVQD